MYLTLEQVATVLAGFTFVLAVIYVGAWCRGYSQGLLAERARQKSPRVLPMWKSKTTGTPFKLAGREEVSGHE